MLILPKKIIIGVLLLLQLFKVSDSVLKGIIALRWSVLSDHSAPGIKRMETNTQVPEQQQHILVSSQNPFPCVLGESVGFLSAVRQMKHGFTVRLRGPVTDRIFFYERSASQFCPKVDQKSFVCVYMFLYLLPKIPPHKHVCVHPRVKTLQERSLHH